MTNIDTDPFRFNFMLDGFLFRKVSGDPAIAIEQIEDEVLNGRGAYGMLAVTHRNRDRGIVITPLHLKGKADWPTQRSAALEWLNNHHDQVWKHLSIPVGAC